MNPILFIKAPTLDCFVASVAPWVLQQSSRRQDSGLGFRGLGFRGSGFRWLLGWHGPGRVPRQFRRIWFWGDGQLLIVYHLVRYLFSCIYSIPRICLWSLFVLARPANWHWLDVSRAWSSRKPCTLKPQVLNPKPKTQSLQPCNPHLHEPSSSFNASYFGKSLSNLNKPKCQKTLIP